MQKVGDEAPHPAEWSRGPRGRPDPPNGGFPILKQIKIASQSTTTNGHVTNVESVPSAGIFLGPWPGVGIAGPACPDRVAARPHLAGAAGPTQKHKGDVRTQNLARSPGHPKGGRSGTPPRPADPGAISSAHPKRRHCLGPNKNIYSSFVWLGPKTTQKPLPGARNRPPRSCAQDSPGGTNPGGCSGADQLCNLQYFPSRIRARGFRGPPRPRRAENRPGPDLSASPPECLPKSPRAIVSSHVVPIQARTRSQVVPGIPSREYCTAVAVNGAD